MRRIFQFGMMLLSALLIGCPPFGSDSGDEEEAKWRSSAGVEELGWVLSVAGRSADEIYAVGGVPDRGGIRRFDGEDWRSVSVPGETPLLTWVHCFDDGRPVVAGFRGRVLWRRGDGWELQKTPTDQNLWGIWGRARDDVWAVGGDGDAISGSPTILHWDGERWDELEIPELARDGVRAFFKVWGTGPDDVYAVGQNGAIVRWNGERLVDESPDTRKDLISIWGNSGRIAAVGGRGNGVVAIRDGGAWEVRSLKPLIGTSGIWVPNPRTAWVAGAGGVIARVDLTSDSLERDVFELDTELDFHAIFGLEGTGLYAVGGNIDRPAGPYRGTAYHRGAIE